MAPPLMPKATAVWLVDNTSLTFEQIAEYCGLHRLEVQGIADGEVAVGIQGLDPHWQQSAHPGGKRACRTGRIRPAAISGQTRVSSLRPIAALKAVSDQPDGGRFRHERRCHVPSVAAPAVGQARRQGRLFEFRGLRSRARMLFQVLYASGQG